MSGLSLSVEHWIGAVSAVAALITALVTVWLAVATGRAARAASRAADHIPRVERAYVFVRLRQAQAALGGDGGMATVGYGIFNYGKTPAIVDSATADLRLVAPGAPAGEHEPMWQGYIVLPGEEWNPEGRPFCAEKLSAEECAAIASGRMELRFEGAVRYRDMFGAARVTRFRYAYSPELQRFERAGDAGDNERS